MGAVTGIIKLGNGAFIEHENPIRLIGPISIRHPIKIGFYSYITANAKIGKIESIGRYCSIGPGLTAGLSSHPTHWLSTSTIQYSKTKFGHSDWHQDFQFTKRTAETDPSTQAPSITIGNDVWIGSGVTILNGVTIGDGAIIAAGAIVTKSVPPYAIVGGVPAQILRMRFDDATIARLLASQWWQFDARALSGLPFDKPELALELLQTKKDAGQISPAPPNFEKLELPPAKKERPPKQVHAIVKRVPLPKAQKVICSGFSFSGASAILDFLSDHEGLVKFPGGEMRLISNRFSFSGVLAEVEKKGSVSPNTIKKIQALLQGEMPGDDHASLSIRKSIAAIKKALGSFYLPQVEAYVDTVRRYPSNKKSILNASRTFISSLCDYWAYEKSSHSVLLDQAVRPWGLEKLALFDEATVILSRRDLRDQIIERARHSIQDDGFSTAAVEYMNRMESARARLPSIYKTQLVWFEDFVLKRATRMEILAHIGNMGNPPSRVTENFNPLASRKNLLLYKQRPDLCPALSDVHQPLLYEKTGALEMLKTSCLDLWEYGESAKLNKAGALQKTRPLSSL